MGIHLYHALSEISFVIYFSELFVKFFDQQVCKNVMERVREFAGNKGLSYTDKSMFSSVISGRYTIRNINLSWGCPHPQRKKTL